jgi:hypothetical protein
VALLRVELGFAALASCYSPTVRDCALPCASAADCAAGQACSADHRCTWSAASATCAASDGGAAPLDASRDGDRGSPHDADRATPHDAARPPPDAPITDVTIHVTVDGPGEVLVDGSATCSDDCMLRVPIGAVALLVAIPKNKALFTGWSGACAGQGAACAFVPIVPVGAGAKFTTHGQ